MISYVPKKEFKDNPCKFLDTIMCSGKHKELTWRNQPITAFTWYGCSVKRFELLDYCKFTKASLLYNKKTNKTYLISEDDLEEFFEIITTNYNNLWNHLNAA